MLQKTEWRTALARRQLERPDGTVVPLTSAACDLLAVMATVPGEAMDRDRLTREVLHRPCRSEDRSLDNLVHRIRRKLGSTGAGEVIFSVRNQR